MRAQRVQRQGAQERSCSAVVSSNTPQEFPTELPKIKMFKTQIQKKNKDAEKETTELKTQILDKTMTIAALNRFLDEDFTLIKIARIPEKKTKRSNSNSSRASRVVDEDGAILKE